MKTTFSISLLGFVLFSVLVASALPTMAGRLQSYDGATGIMVLELEDKTLKKFILTNKTQCEWMGRNTSPGALVKGSKVSIQIAGALNASPLKAAKVVDWSNSEKIVAKGASAPYHTPVAQFASTAGGGGVPDGAPKMNSSAHQTMASIAHGGSQNQETGPAGHSNPNSQAAAISTPSYQSGGSIHYTNQGQSLTAPLEMMNIDPYSSSPDPYSSPGMTGYPQMGSAGDMTSMMGIDGNDGEGDSSGMHGQETAYGGGGERITGRVMQASVEQGFVVLQSYEHPNLLRVLLQQAANAPLELLQEGQMIEVVGSQTPQGFKATEIKAANGF